MRKIQYSVLLLVLTIVSVFSSAAQETTTEVANPDFLKWLIFMTAALIILGIGMVMWSREQMGQGE
jgi:hypothetical protein